VTTKAPVEQYNLAALALESAKAVEAGKHASGHYHKAQESYRKAQILFKAREYEKAREEFDMAREEAEKAENISRLIRWKNGEIF
jgi:hypothetical protein